MTTRNSNAHFELAPQAAIERSTFDRSTNVKTSFNVGQLVPFFVDEILPGDTYRIKTSKVFRLQTLITPVMDNLYLDTYYFFVPNRLVWDSWEDFIGGGQQNGWTTIPNKVVPICTPPYDAEAGDQNGWFPGTIADYMGIPPYRWDSNEISGVNALPFRCYAKIVEDWFRDENIDQPVYFYTGDSNTEGSNGSDYVTDIALGGMPFIANKFHDYYTSCTPRPQKGEAVPFIDGFAPVYPLDTTDGKFSEYLPVTKVAEAIVRTNTVVGTTHSYRTNKLMGTNTQSQVVTGDAVGISELSNRSGSYITNLFADLKNAVIPGGYSPITINTLRQAFQVQRMLERDARGGTRYIELLRSHFHVQSPDARLQRAEYLGGNRVPFNIEQVLQTSSTDSETPQGNVAGWSQTNDVSYDVEKSFVEHGWIIGLMVARYDHTYQQGLEKMWFRRTRYDYYWPTLAHIGEQAVMKAEIFWQGNNQPDAADHYNNQINPNLLFGYQEAWAEYRYKPNMVTGFMRTDTTGSLDFWHFADWYSNPPYLSSSWLKEDKSNVDRCLAVTSEVTNQIFGDVFVECKATRAMPLYSIPGLVDHF